MRMVVDSAVKAAGQLGHLPGAQSSHCCLSHKEEAHRLVGGAVNQANGSPTLGPEVPREHFLHCEKPLGTGSLGHNARAGVCGAMNGTNSDPVKGLCSVSAQCEICPTTLILLWVALASTVAG